MRVEGGGVPPILLYYVLLAYDIEGAATSTAAKGGRGAGASAKLRGATPGQGFAYSRSYVRRLHLSTVLHLDFDCASPVVSVERL